MFTQYYALLPLLSLASAHFSIEYPEARGDPFGTGASEWIYPCGNVNQTEQTNRTVWPLAGGSLKLDLHHPWTYYFINIGLGTDYPSFNISLTPLPVNETGNGTLCLPEVKLPSGISVTDGQNASIQVVTVGESGSALYVCSDITFSSSASLLANDDCVSTPGLTTTVLGQNEEKATNTSSGAAATSSTPSAANAGMSTSMWVTGVVTGLTALGVSWFL